jgi:endonuclease-3 related protein
MAKIRPPDRSAPGPRELYEILHAHYGELEWWPADGPFEVMVGAVLTQRTAWRNVERALDNLRDASVVDMRSLLCTPLERLEVLVRPSGTYRQKARRLLALFQMVDRKGSGSLDTFLDLHVQELRGALLSVNGIGPETADSIALYAAGRPVFVVDAYTRRVLERLGIEAGGSYDDVARWFTDGLREDPALYNNYHAALVELAKEHCRKVPRCADCPLLHLCATGKGKKSP